MMTRALFGIVLSSLIVSACSSDKGPTGPAPLIVKPNPIISRGAGVQVFSSSTNGSGVAVHDGNYHNGGWNAGMPTAAAPTWVALKLAPGPTHVLVSWDDGG